MGGNLEKEVEDVKKPSKEEVIIRANKRAQT